MIVDVLAEMGPVDVTFLAEISDILHAHGFDRADAARLAAEGMGPAEVEQRAAIAPNAVGGLQFTHGMRRCAVSNCLGQSKPIEHTYDDGSYNCPHCYGAVKGDWLGCRNPACFARVDDLGRLDYPIAEAQKREAAAKAAAEEKASQRRLADWRQEYADTRRRERAERISEVIAEARRRGACERCVNVSDYGPVKYVVHRKACPKAKRRE